MSGAEVEAHADETTTLPRRTTSLCVPGTRTDRHGKALQSPCSEVVLDLEDAVAPALKEEARAAVVRTLASAEWADRTVAVRVNAGSAADLEAVAGIAGVPGLTVLLPKVGRPEEVLQAAAALEGSGIGLQALIETPAGSAAAGEIAVAHPSLQALLLGYADLAAELGRRGGEGDTARWLVHQERVLGAARAAGIQALDGPFLDLGDEAGLVRSARTAKELGFDGKWAVHPKQLKTIARILAPSATERAWAGRMLSVLEDGAGVGVVDGKMVDEVHRKRALRLRAFDAALPAAASSPTAPARAPRRRRVASAYADELEVGQRFEAPGLTLDDGLATLHRAACGDRLPLALDAALAEAVTGVPGRLAHPALVADVVIGQSTAPSGRVLGNLFYRGFVLAPVALGTTLRTTTEVVAIAPTKDGGRAKVTLRATTVDEHGSAVASFLRCPLLPARGPIEPRGEAPDAPVEVTLPDWHLAGHPQGERLVVGDTIEVEAHETVTLAPELARATLNLAMTHTDAAAGAHGKRLVYGGHVIGIGLAHASRALPGLVTVLAWRSCDHLGPVFEGDRLATTIDVLAVDGPTVDLRVTVASERGPVLDWQPVVLHAP
jgi:citrate lyase beta subunit/acyl dehydratase